MARKIRFTISKEKIFGKNAHVIKVNGIKKFFEFSRAEAEAKVRKLKRSIN